jgi:hypothetical protein
MAWGPRERCVSRGVGNVQSTTKQASKHVQGHSSVNPARVTVYQRAYVRERYLVRRNTWMGSAVLRWCYSTRACRYTTFDVRQRWRNAHLA